MAKVTVSTNFQLTEMVDGFVTDDLANEIGETLKEGVVDALSKGISPVEGARRFEKYKDPDIYPGKKKPKRPVNLYLSGALYSSFSFFRRGSQVVFGIFDKKVAEYAEAHQEGTKHMAQRQILPGPGEQFQVSILRKVLAIYTAKMSAMINKSNQK